MQTIGVERRAELATCTNEIARKLGTEFGGLHFQSSAIGDVVHCAPVHIAVPKLAADVTNEIGCTMENGVGESEMDVLMALHACDTATDDAILHGITNNASIIVVSPCCHKEVRRQLESHNGQVAAFAASGSNSNVSNIISSEVHPLSNVLMHGIYRERHAEMLTDTLRALCLELAGYETKIFEFVSGEHTTKNTMIAATKRTLPLTDAKKEAAVKKIRELMASCGIRSQRLVSMLQIC